MNARAGRCVLETFVCLATARVTLIRPVRVFYPRAIRGFASGFELVLMILLRVERFLYARQRERAFGSHGVKPADAARLGCLELAVAIDAQFVPDNLSLEARARRLVDRVFLRSIA